MLTKIKALWNLFKAGEAVSDPAKWKGRQITSNMLAAVILALVYLAKAFGLEIPIDAETATVIAAGLLAIVNTILTLTTSKTVGLPSNKSPVQDVQQADVGEAAHEEQLPHVDQPQVANHGIDDDVRARALKWAREQRYEDIDPNSRSGG